MKYRTVGAYFAGNTQRYDYYIPEGDDPQVGDIIITSTEITSRLHMLHGPLTADDVVAWTSNRYGGADKANLAIVAEVHNIPSTKAARFYLARFDRKTLLENHQNTGRLKTLLEKRKAALAALEKMAKEQDRLAIYRRMAETNPEARALLDVLEGDLSAVPAPLEVESEEDPPSADRRRKPTVNNTDPTSPFYDA